MLTIGIIVLVMSFLVILFSFRHHFDEVFTFSVTILIGLIGFIIGLCMICAHCDEQYRKDRLNPELYRPVLTTNYIRIK